MCVDWQFVVCLIFSQGRSPLPCGNTSVTRVDPDGEFWNVIVGAIVGGTISLVSSVVSEIIEGDITWKDIGQIAISTAIGAAEGVLTALAPGASVAISTIANATDTALNGFVEGDDIQTIIVDTTLSAMIGSVARVDGSDFVKGGKLINQAVGSIGNTIKKGVHPVVKKAARKSAKKAARYIGRSLGQGFLYDIVYGVIYEFCSWTADAIIN